MLRLGRVVMGALLAALVLVLLVSRFTPKIETVYVSGHVHYDEADILRLARVRPGQPLLWVTTWQVAGLERDPWISRAQVVRKLPNTLYINVTEHAPVLVKGDTAYAIDGTVLPNATAADRTRATPLTGWGVDRSQEAVDIYRLVANMEPRMVSYAPSGFTVSFAGFSLYTPDVALLKAHWSAFVAQQGERVAVYPWGVSVKQR